MTSVWKARYEKAKAAGAAAAKKYRERRTGEKEELIALGVGGLASAAVAAGEADGVITALPGGFVGHSDFTKKPSMLRSKRGLIFVAAAGAAGYALRGAGRMVAVMALSAAAGRAVAKDKATYLGETGAVTPEQLVKDIGEEQAKNVAKAKGYKS